MSVRMVRLEDVCEINPRAPKNIKDDTPVSFLPMSAVSEDGHVSFEEARTYGDVKKGYTYFERGDVLVAKITPCFENGKAASTETIQNKLGFGSTEFHVLRPSKDLNPKYVFYLIWSERFRKIGEKGMTGSAGQKRVPADLLRRLEIPLPPLDEQKRIAAILDKADALRAKRRQAIALLNSLTQSIFLEMFGDPVSNPKNYPNLSVGQALADGHILEIQDGNHGERHPKVADFSNEGIPFVTANCFRKGTLNLRNAYKLPDVWLSKLRVGFAKSGDVLLTHKGTIGEAAVLSENTPHAILSPQVTYYRPGPSLNSSFLKGVFASPSFQAILSNASEQSTRAYIGVTKQLRLPIIIPNIEDQARYAERIRGVEAYARNLSRIHMQQDALFASLQHRAFTGQL